MSILTQGPVESIRQVGDELRAAARAKGSFLKPAKLQFGAWGVLLSFGTKEEMLRLEGMENLERERRKLPKREATGPSRDTWHLSVQLIVPEEVVQDDALDQLSMLAGAVGVPPGKLGGLETLWGSKQVMHWQWRDE